MIRLITNKEYFGDNLKKLKKYNIGLHNISYHLCYYYYLLSFPWDQNWAIAYTMHGINMQWSTAGESNPKSGLLFDETFKFTSKDHLYPKNKFQEVMEKYQIVLASYKQAGMQEYCS